MSQGRIQGGGPGGQDPPPFGGPPNFIKREKTLRVGARKCRILVLNSYPDPPPFRNPVSAPVSHSYIERKISLDIWVCQSINLWFPPGLFSLRAMFTDAMKERQQEEIQLNGVSATGLRHLVDYAYTSRLTLNLREYHLINTYPLLSNLHFQKGILLSFSQYYQHFRMYWHYSHIFFCTLLNSCWILLKKDASI